MRDYEGLVKALRENAEWAEGNIWEVPIMLPDNLKQAADAIEELLAYADLYKGLTEKGQTVARKLIDAYPKWIKIESRPMAEEERKEWSEHIGYDIEYEDAIIYTSELPDDGQEVLVCNKWGHVWIDTFSDDPDYGVGFEENGDMDGIIAWMPKPKPYEPPKEDDNG